MKDWLAKNWWSVLIALLTISSTYTLYGFRISALESRADTQQRQILSLQQASNQTAIDIAKIQKDIEYIRFSIDRVFPKVTN